MGHALRLPAGKHKTVGIRRDGIKHFGRIDTVNGLLAVGQYRGAVIPNPGKLRSCPVKDGHKVVADNMNVFLSQTLQGLNIIVNILVPVRGTDLDRVMDVYAFNAGNMQTGGLHFHFAGMDLLPAP